MLVLPNKTRIGKYPNAYIGAEVMKYVTDFYKFVYLLVLFSELIDITYN